MGNMLKAFLLRTKVLTNITVDSQEEICVIELQAELAPFFMKHHFYLKERMTDKL